MSGFQVGYSNLPPGGMGPQDPTDIDTDPDCEVCQEASSTPHAYKAPSLDEDGEDAWLTGTCQFELPSGSLCGDEELATQHDFDEDFV